MFVKVYRKEREREDNAILFHAAQAKDRAEPEDDAREGTQVLLADTSQRLGREQTLRPRIKAPQLCDTKELDRTTHAPNRTPRPPFSQPSRPPRSLSVLYRLSTAAV
jgi:hypothetical protein